MMNIGDENSIPLSKALKLAQVASDDDLSAAFYRWLAERFDSNEYEKIKNIYKISGESPKFLAVCWRTRRLLPIAKWLSWHEKCDLRTLDLGSGAGHMGLIANFFGHSNIGIDRSRRFDRLREFWGQPAIIHNIEPRVPFPPIGRFHSITSLLTNYGRQWTVDCWNDFLDRIIDDHLEPDGQFLIHFPGNQILDYRNTLRERASRIEGEGRFMFFVRK